MPTEENVIVLDYLEEGRVRSDKPSYKRQKRLTQVLGIDYFSLLEVIAREDAEISPGDKLYIGKDTREKVHHILRRVDYDDLTSAAKSELKYALDKLIHENEERFVEFFNKCGPLTTRKHRLELLPGVGKKHMWAIVKAREVKPFESFEDIAERVKLLPDPAKLVVKRIEWEVKGNTDQGKPIKYKLFVGVPFFKKKEKESKKE